MKGLGRAPIVRCIQCWVLHVPKGFCAKFGKCGGKGCRIKGSHPELSTFFQLEPHTCSQWASKYMISTQTLKLLYRSWTWIWTWKYICGKTECGSHLSIKPTLLCVSGLLLLLSFANPAFMPVLMLVSLSTNPRRQLSDLTEVPSHICLSAVVKIEKHRKILFT